MNDKNKEVTEIVKSNLERMGSLSLNEIVEIIRPYYDFDVQGLIEAELRREARRIIDSIKDSQDERIYEI